ncbi:MAG TPA: M20/M25/M40 family metallo-hydrolase [Bryobacteraceae bacterium]|nr:M20/M25/M40 family metallo-hydrolase [Bryobacteraceae bacterium]
MLRSWLILSALVASSIHAQNKPIDWNAVNSETLRYFTDIIRQDTSNPPGNETMEAKYLQAILEREGIPTKLVGTNQQRLSVIARLKGNGSKKPVIVMGHTDVVPVQRDRWTQNPFGASIVDGFIWGRGTLDDKPLVLGSLMTILLFKRSGLALDRDIIFIAESGEEGGGGTGFGMNYIIQNNWPDIEAEYALSECGDFRSVGGKVLYQKVAVSEKVGRGMRLIAHGTAGHGSQPREDSAIVHLSAAVAAVGHWQPPMHLTDTTRTYLEKLQTVAAPDIAARIRGLFDSSQAEESQAWFRKNDIELNSELRTTVDPTIFQGGFRSNVLSSEAIATLDIRAVPGEDMQKYKEELIRVINDPEVMVEANGNLDRPAPPDSSTDTEMFRALEHAGDRAYPGIPTFPWMWTGATDMRGLRARGVQSYGIGPEYPQEDTLLHAYHSDNERVKEEGIYKFVHYMYDAVREVAAKPAK